MSRLLVRTAAAWVSSALLAAATVMGQAPESNPPAEGDIVEVIGGDEGEPSGSEQAAGDGQDNIVETIGDAPPRVAAGSVGAPQPSADRFELHGWSRLSGEFGFSRDHYRAAAPVAGDLRYDALVARAQLFTWARYSHERWFEVSLSGVLSYSFFEQGTADPDVAFNGFNGAAGRGQFEASLYELFVGFYSKAFDLRVGQQRVAWGRADFFSPNDVVNTRDGRDPFVSEPELRFVPTPVIRGDLNLGFGKLQMVVSPVFVPPKFDVYGSNWAALQPGAPAGLRGFASLLDRSTDPSIRSAVQESLGATRLPASDFTEPSAGVQFAWSAGGVEVGHYYHYGFDGPWLVLEPDLALTLANTDYARIGLSDLQPVLQAIDDGRYPLQAIYVRRHNVGLDLSATLGPLAIRVDAAFQSTRVFYRADLQGVLSPAVQGVLALEYQAGDVDRIVLAELIYMRVIDPPADPLLFYERDNIGMAALFRWVLFGPLGVELRAIVGVQRFTTIMQPQLNLKFGQWLLAFGGLHLQGEPLSFGDYFYRNSEVYAKLKLAF